MAMTAAIRKVSSFNSSPKEIKSVEIAVISNQFPRRSLRQFESHAAANIKFCANLQFISSLFLWFLISHVRVSPPTEQPTHYTEERNTVIRHFFVLLLKKSSLKATELESNWFIGFNLRDFLCWISSPQVDAEEKMKSSWLLSFALVMTISSLFIAGIAAAASVSGEIYDGRGVKLNGIGEDLNSEKGEQENAKFCSECWEIVKLKYHISNFSSSLSIISWQADVLRGKSIWTIAVRFVEHGRKVIGCQDCAEKRPLLFRQSIWQTFNAAFTLIGNERRTESVALVLLHWHHEPLSMRWTFERRHEIILNKKFIENMIAQAIFLRRDFNGWENLLH